MIIAISSTGRDLDSEIDPRFGRCAFFIFYNTEDSSIKVFENESTAMSGGAGIQSAQFIAAKGVKAVLTGNCGPNAVKTLTAAGIKIYLGQSGTVCEVIENFRNNSINPSKEANVSDHFGMKGNTSSFTLSTGNTGMEWTPGSGRGMGKGGGKGMGICGGKGKGGGMGRSMGSGERTGFNPIISGQGSPVQVPPGNLSKDQELELLKEQSRELQRQIGEIQDRIDKLDGKV